MNEASTVSIKQAQLTKGFFTLGSGKEVILIMGSCRVLAYVNYFNDWNKANGNRFTIHSIDPFNWNWDIANNRTNYESALIEQELNASLLDMLKSVDVFIHEYYQNGGMFNTAKDGEKNVYQFGLQPKTDICIPSLNDRFILVADIVRFDTEIRKKAMQDYNVLGQLSDQTLSEIDAVRCKNLLKFWEICELSDLPEFGDVVKKTYRDIRYWHNYNHVNKNFTNKIFFMLCDRLGIKPDYHLIDAMPDVFANIFTPLTEYDELDWNEPVKPLRELL